MPWPLLAPEARPFDVVGFGENSIDLVAVVDAYPEQNSKQAIRRFARLPGGQVATAMAACARLGWRARYVGRVGDDELGALTLASLNADGVDTTAVGVIPGATSRFAIILIDERTTARTVLWDRDPRLSLSAADVPLTAVASGRVLHVDAVDVEASAAAARAARAAGARTTIDIDHVAPGVDGLLAEIDVIIAAEGVPAALTGERSLGRALEVMAAAYPNAVVGVTLGEQGSLARAAGHEIRTPAFRVAAVDTTGAGDVFRAGFIAGWLAGGADAQVEDALRYANAAAALACRALGAREAAPRAAEVEALLRAG